MSRFIDFLDNFLHDRLGDIELSMVARIEKFDKQKMRADVTPLMKRKSGKADIDYAQLKDIPVNFISCGDYYIRPDYKQGDFVHIAFSGHDIEEALRGRKSVPGEKLFTPENAFVVGGLAKTGWIAPPEFSEEGILIGNKKASAFMQCKGDKIIMKFNQGATSIEFSAAGMKIVIGGIPCVEFSTTGMKMMIGGVSYDFVTHTHSTGVGPSGPPMS